MQYTCTLQLKSFGSVRFSLQKTNKYYNSKDFKITHFNIDDDNGKLNQENKYFLGTKSAY